MPLPEQLSPVAPISHATSAPDPGPRNPASVPASGRLSWGPLCFVAGFAFLLASFPARNSDLWLHLAAGRGLVQAPGLISAMGEARPGWLYDVLCYALFSVVGGPGVVVFKALVVVVLSTVLLRKPNGDGLVARCRLHRTGPVGHEPPAAFAAGDHLGTLSRSDGARLAERRMFSAE